MRQKPRRPSPHPCLFSASSDRTADRPTDKTRPKKQKKRNKTKTNTIRKPRKIGYRGGRLSTYKVRAFIGNDPRIVSDWFEQMGRFDPTATAAAAAGDEEAHDAARRLQGERPPCPRFGAARLPSPFGSTRSLSTVSAAGMPAEAPASHGLFLSSSYSNDCGEKDDGPNARPTTHPAYGADDEPASPPLARHHHRPPPARASTEPRRSLSYALRPQARPTTTPGRPRARVEARAKTLDEYYDDNPHLLPQLPFTWHHGRRRRRLFLFAFFVFVDARPCPSPSTTACTTPATSKAGSSSPSSHHLGRTQLPRVRHPHPAPRQARTFLPAARHAKPLVLRPADWARS